MKNLETRIEKLESQTEASPPEGCIGILLKLRGFNGRSVEDDLGPNPTIEEALAALRGKNTRLSGGT